ncbi:dTDP-4-dehydrorhamnose reductase [hydrothermal vent metagenome]|uniref:dTDP-4-dehydrorhamnose reductase n=1 Tax=hydrothermal vent metagenome TaxID=652676 RepID=A0A3B0VND3_9ZZZZ
MKILITGADGQLGWELRRVVPAGVELTTCNSAELDITNGGLVDEVVSRLSPEIIINAAAYTAVDKAENEAERAMAVNRDGVAHLAAAAGAVGAGVIHVSTDFVFDGCHYRPYLPEDTPHPTGVYGASKLAGERMLLEKCPDAAIIRTAWVYSAHGNNFVKTMLRLMAERDELGVVADQIGSPTWAAGLAQALWRLAAEKLTGIYHWTDAGVASWYDFACAIQEEALRLGILRREAVIRPLRSEDYPTLARRPPYSVLDKTILWEKFGVAAPHWRLNLKKMLAELKNV